VRLGDERRVVAARALGGERVDVVVGERPAFAQRMDGAVAEDVVDGEADFARPAQEMCVVAVGEDLALAAHELVEGAGHADLEALHGSAELDVVGRLDDEMDVVALDGEMDEAKSETGAPFGEGALERAEAAVRAEVPDFAADSDGDVEGLPAESLALSMRDLWAGMLALAAGAAALAAPGGELQGELFHRPQGRRGV
jgi:hypothetical protein